MPAKSIKIVHIISSIDGALTSLKVLKILVELKRRCSPKLTKRSLLRSLKRSNC